MIQRKQTLFLMAAIILTVMCLCMQIGSFSMGGLDVARVYNLWYTDPLGKHHLDTWPLMALLLPTTVIGLITIFIYKRRKVQAMFCLVNMLMIVAWYICLALVGQMVGDKSWNFVDFAPSWPAALPGFSCVLYFMARHAILADEKLVRSLDRIR